MANTKQPTVKQAVDWLLRAATREYRVDCLAYWREKYGDKFADEVKAGVEAAWKK